MLIIYGSTGAGYYPQATSSVTTSEGCVAKSDGYIAAALSLGRLVFYYKGNSLTADRVIERRFEEAVGVRVLITYSGTGVSSYPWATGSIATLEECTAKLDGYIVATLLLG